MADVIHCLRSRVVPPEVRLLQIAVAAILDDVYDGDDRFYYVKTLEAAKRLHDLGVRVVYVS